MKLSFLYIYSLIIIIYLLYIIILLPYYLSIYQYFTLVVSYYFCCFISLPCYRKGTKTMLHRCFCIVLCYFFSAFWSKIGKNSQIFCNFFSLCIN